MKTTVGYCIKETVMRQMVNKNVCGGRLYILGGLASVSQLVLSIPPHQLMILFLPILTKICAVVYKLHKKHG